MKAVLSILADSAARARRIARARGTAVDLIELRLDRIPTADVGALVEEIEQPVLAALIPRSEGGCFEGEREEGLGRLLAAARAGAALVDIDASQAGAAARLPAACRPLISHHERGPLAGDPLAVIRRVQGLARGAAVKVVFHLEQVEQAPAIYRALERSIGEVTCFAMGAGGRTSRLLAGVFGSRLCYLAPDAAHLSAPGQYTLEEWLALRPPGGIRVGMPVFGVVGHPIGHSISPAVHRAAFDALGIAALYLAFDVRDAGAFLSGHDLAPLRGYSVTLPHKESAAAWCRRRDSEVERIGAANTLVRADGGWWAANTDCDALVAALRAGGCELCGQRCLVLGAGGAARAALFGLARAGARPALAARHPERIQRVAAELGAEVIPWSRRGTVRAEVLINATPLGMSPREGEAPFEEGWITPGMTVLDMVYRPLHTELLQRAARRGARAITGLEMFLEQAARQCALFTGREPPREAMRRAAGAILGGPGGVRREAD